MTEDEKIDAAVNAIIDLLKLGAGLFPALAAAMPVIILFIRWEAHKLKTGISSGAIVPDGDGGFVPASNSRFDPKTGKFL